MLQVFKLNRPLVGMEIDALSVRVAHIEKGRNGFRLLQCAEIPLPDETLKPSYNQSNIADLELFRAKVKEAVSFIGQDKTIRLGLSLPNEVIKISIQKFAEVPKAKSEKEKMIAWWAKRAVRLPTDKAKIDYIDLGQRSGGEHLLLIAVAIQNVIREYELALKTNRIHAEVIRPACINQINFYGLKLPFEGIFAYLGLFENFFSFFVFEHRQLIFYRGIKRGFSDLFFFQDVDMTMQHYLNANPDRELERLIIGSHVGFHQELEEVFRNLCDMEVQIVDQNQIFDHALHPIEGQGDELMLSSYDAAIGAALSTLD